jgi:ribosomal protein L17
MGTEWTEEEAKDLEDILAPMVTLAKTKTQQEQSDMLQALLDALDALDKVRS